MDNIKVTKRWVGPLSGPVGPLVGPVGQGRPSLPGMPGMPGMVFGG